MSTLDKKPMSPKNIATLLTKLGALDISCEPHTIPYIYALKLPYKWRDFCNPRVDIGLLRSPSFPGRAQCAPLHPWCPAMAVFAWWPTLERAVWFAVCPLSEEQRHSWLLHMHNCHVDFVQLSKVRGSFWSPQEKVILVPPTRTPMTLARTAWTCGPDGPDMWPGQPGHVAGTAAKIPTI